MPTVKDVLNLFYKLTEAEQKSMVSIVSGSASNVSIDIKSYIVTKRFANGRVCPYCKGSHVIRNGHRKDGTQQYKCKDCNKAFIASSNSIADGTKKPLTVWEKYIDCMINGLSIRKTADICNIHRNTAFLWRRKILAALQEIERALTLDGIVEADETFFPVSYKGNHTGSKDFSMPRKAHKRGHSVHTRGVSTEQVCVPCAINRNGQSIAKASNTGRATTKSLHFAYDGKISSSAILVTDKHNAYTRFANTSKIKLVQIKGGKSKSDIYNIQRINNYHSRLKKFMRGFNGVSTKYLNQYLLWNNFINIADNIVNKRNAFLSYALATYKTVRCDSVALLPPIPFPA